MPIAPYDFASVSVITLPGGNESAEVDLVIITGYALINFPAEQRNQGDWVRDEVVFSLGPAIPRLWSSSMIAFPATVETLDPASSMFGWGVDSVNTSHDATSQKVVAHVQVVSKTPASNILRIGFQINAVGQG
jgi:hypothetical protein